MVHSHACLLKGARVTPSADGEVYVNTPAKIPLAVKKEIFTVRLWNHYTVIRNIINLALIDVTLFNQFHCILPMCCALNNSVSSSTGRYQRHPSLEAGQ